MIVVETLAISFLSSDFVRAAIEMLTGERAKTAEGIVDLVTNRDRRQKLLKIVWVVAVLFVLVLSGIALGLSIQLAGTLKPGVIVTVVLWAALLGGSALAFLSHRVLTAVFGGVVGVSLSEASTSAAGLFVKVNTAIVDLAQQIGRIPSPTVGASSDFISWMIWLFMGIFGLLCLPAFFTE